MRYGRTLEEGFLPVYSVDTEEEARQLLTTACPTNLAGEFISPELAREQTLENLDAFGDRLEMLHSEMKVCQCYLECRDDSMSGRWHTHEEQPCATHPEAPMLGV